MGNPCPCLEAECLLVLQGGASAEFSHTIAVIAGARHAVWLEGKLGPRPEVLSSSLEWNWGSASISGRPVFLLPFFSQHLYSRSCHNGCSHPDRTVWRLTGRLFCELSSRRKDDFCTKSWDSFKRSEIAGAPPGSGRLLVIGRLACCSECCL